MSGHDDKPVTPLLSDRAFWGLNLTQFLGAFNDNLFKQLVMLICVDRVKSGGQDLQGLAMILFAWPFIAFSGYAGFLSDRFSKRTIIVLCKAAEFVIVVLGLVGFATGSMGALLAVLCLMGVHSAFFGPSKYGILPEILRPTDLPRANGMILMATFLAIIFGLSAAGAAKQMFDKQLWVASVPCLIIALAGLGTSLLIRPTPVAQPDLRFQMSSVGIAPDTRATLRQNPTLLGVLFMSSVFWFVGGTVYPPTINAFGKDQLRFDDLSTGIMAASTGLGIAVGCVLAGILSRNRVPSWLVRTGAWGLAISLAALCLPGPGFNAVRDEIHRLKISRDQTGSFRRYTVSGKDAGSSAVVGECLAIRVAVDADQEEASTLLSDLARRLDLDVDCHWELLPLEPTAKVSVNLSDVSLKRAIDSIFEGIPIAYGSNDGGLIIGSTKSPPENSVETLAAYERAEFFRGSLLGPYGCVAALISVGLFAGFFSVPLQVYLQAAAPHEQKGRIIGALNLFNWFGIAGSGVIYSLARLFLVGEMELPHGCLFGFAAILILPVALFYRPPELKIDN